jgi:hypothetical protein
MAGEGQKEKAAQQPIKYPCTNYREAAEKKAAEKKAAEQREIDRRLAEKREAERKAAADRRAAEMRAAQLREEEEQMVISSASEEEEEEDDDNMSVDTEEAGPEPMIHPDSRRPKQRPTAQQWQSDGSADPRLAKWRAMLPDGDIYTDDYILSLTPDVIYRIAREEKQYRDDMERQQRQLAEKKEAEANKPAKKLQTRLKVNFEVVKRKPEPVEAGEDNRVDILHDARFLGAMAITAVQMWLEARRRWGLDGTIPLACYDAASMGMAGVITTKGWEVLHDPGSDEITIKLYSVKNIRHTGTGKRQISLDDNEGVTIEDSWKELTEMGEVRAALRNLRRAARLVRYWDLSIEVLEAYLYSNNFHDTDTQVK